MHQLIVAARKHALDPRLGYDLLRMYLGIALFVRGALFIADPNRVVSLVRRSSEWLWPFFVAHAVAVGHICGGILLALGLATRLASVVQIPILVGAVFFVHWREGLLGPSQSLELAGLVLVMLVVFSIFGSGPLSLDNLVFRRGQEETTSRKQVEVEESQREEREQEEKKPRIGGPSTSYP